MTELLEKQRLIWEEEQRDLASKVIVLPDEDDEKTISLADGRFKILAQHTEVSKETRSRSYYGGVDVSFPETEEDPSVAVYVVVDKETLEVVYEAHEYFRLTVPYIPSFLAFREIDPLVRLVERQQSERPELTPLAILVDGNGVLHPRSAGIACFLGVRTGIPTIGVGKTLFYQGGITMNKVLRGLEDSLKALNDISSELPEHPYNGRLILDSKGISHETSSKNEHLDRRQLVQGLSQYCNGFAVPLVDKDRGVLACALVAHGGKIKTGGRIPASGTKNPIFISVGHQVSLQQATQVCADLSKARIPEPVRQADLLGRDLLRKKHKPV